MKGTRSGRTPAVRVKAEEAAEVERILRQLVCGHTVWGHEIDDKNRLLLIRAWIRFARFRPAAQMEKTPVGERRSPTVEAATPTVSGFESRPRHEVKP